MPLYVVATPIGDPEDISLRAQKVLSEADLVIGEEAKPTRRLLKSLGIPPQKPIELLNEHSDSQTIQSLVRLCERKNVALVSDCGTPGFCDPGAELIKASRQRGIEIKTLPGASSLMVFLSASGHRLNQFFFQGFLPANTEERQKRLVGLQSMKSSILLMDTPYRLEKTVQNCAKYFPTRKIILGTELTKPNEKFYEGQAEEVLKDISGEKLEFVLAII